MRTIEEIEKRSAEIVEEAEKPGADVDALKKEALSLKEERESILKIAAEKEEIRKVVAFGRGVSLEKHEESKSVTNEELRNSPKYINAYADYIKTGDDRECRALLTENVSGQLPVPVLVDQTIQTAWERDEIIQRVKKTYFRGNLKVAFERSGDVAYVHTEGTTAPTEESLTLGIVTMIPANIKKWIRISDEVMAMGGEAFLRYIYAELTYQIVKKLAALVVADIAGAGTTHTATAVGLPKITAAPGINTVATAAANLSDEATNICVVMNRLTEVNFRAAYAAGNFAVDPFMGLPRVYTSALPAYDTASANDVYAIVGDLNGAQINFPEGNGVILKFDDLTEAQADLIKVVGREYAAHAVTGPGKLVNIAKPAGT